MRVLGWLLVVSVGSSGCFACKDHDRVPSTSPPIGAATVRSIGPAVMLRHEVFSVAVRDAIVRGDLALARQNAVELGAVTVSGSPEVVERAKEMQDVSKALAHAPDLVSAAHEVGALARTCADCHARLTGPTRLDVRPAPSEERGREGRMRRHVWAMSALWDGLVGNSEAPWRAGAAVLADGSLAASELVPPRSRDPEIALSAASVRSLGTLAMAASDTGVRAKLYGDLLATCADCHARAR